MEISCSTKEWKESRENCRHFLGAAAAAVKSRRLFSLPHVDNRIRISDADTKVEKKAKNRIFFHLHRRYLSFWRMQMSRPFPSPKKNLSIEPLPIISRLNCLFSNLFHWISLVGGPTQSIRKLQKCRKWSDHLTVICINSANRWKGSFLLIIRQKLAYRVKGTLLNNSYLAYFWTDFNYLHTVR